MQKIVFTICILIGIGFFGKSAGLLDGKIVRPVEIRDDVVAVQPSATQQAPTVTAEIQIQAVSTATNTPVPFLRPCAPESPACKNELNDKKLVFPATYTATTVP